MQLLEQETATEGKNIFSLDGREWFRAYSTGGGWNLQNHGDGNFIQANSDCTGCYLEITGYFNDINFSLNTNQNRCNDIDISVNGTLSVDGSTTLGGMTATNSPIGSRYVDSGSFKNGGSTLSASLGTTPTINTVRYEAKTGSSEYIAFEGIELIAQDKFTDATCDTTNTDATVTMDSTAKLSVGLSVTGTGVPAGASVASITNATTFELSAAATATNANQTFTFGGNDISIPAQNVVSYGKKFSLSAAAHHYNPFAFKTDGSTAWASGAHNGTSWPVGTGSSTNIDTATSLGLENWLHSSNYYKPYNGGRVVKWIASDGTIKTSVNVMPPNAQNVAGTAISAKTNASAANDTPLPTFTGVLDQSQTEVSKEYYWREFGNGAANAGGGATAGGWADASMLSGTSDEMAYVMDDGLTALYSSVLRRESVRSSIGFANDAGPPGTGNFWNMTFIGTGISILTHANSATGSVYLNIAQNLPYGTHVIKVQRDSSTNSSTWIDGVAVRSNTSG